MLKRIAAALIALPIFFLAVYFTPDWVLPVLLSLLAALAAYEILHNTHLVRSRALLTLAVLMSAASALLSSLFDLPAAALIVPPAVVIFSAAIFSRKRIDLTAIFVSFFAVLFIPAALASVSRIRAMEHGAALVLLPFLSAWITDTFAYFTGFAIGRHKLAPRISPKKTVEGSIGGVVGCVLVTAAYHLIAVRIWGVSFRLPLLCLLAAAASVVSQLGDLSLSYVKRSFSIKDYGTIMPGHGGVLDRFDSVLFTAPLYELLLTVISVIL